MKIVVATDGSRAAGAALRFASQLVRRQADSELVVVTVCPGRISPGGARSRGGQLAHARKVLVDAARIVPDGAVSARFEVISSQSADDVPEAISRHADRLRADLVVIGSEGRESLTDWVVGGTALRLIYVARRPVTVVRAPRRRSRETGVQ